MTFRVHSQRSFTRIRIGTHRLFKLPTVASLFHHGFLSLNGFTLLARTLPRSFV